MLVQKIFSLTPFPGRPYPANMKHLKIILAVLVLTLPLYTTAAAGRDAVILTETEVQEVITPAVKKEFGIEYPIFRVYSYSESSGRYYLVLTENPYDEEDNKTLNNAIKGFCLRDKAGKLTLVWKMRDFIHEPASDQTEESSIWFWTKYFQIKDFDNDGLIDPILIYGAFGPSGFDDGRVKILIYYKGKKTAIRHQNGVLDDERHTQVDKAFYKLPAPLRDHVAQLLEKMEENSHANFPAGYKTQMKQKSLYWKE